ncbi:MAG: alpha/beta hydrolase [Alphaproteobacteria bacterium]|nr:alpha/beta hydrolase [Alphaproteobacteria bacterium]
MSAVRNGYFEGTGGVRMYYEDTGEGVPIVFVHEFAGDYRSWEPQVRYFSHRFRPITFNARGYPPSDVPTDSELFSQTIAIDDIAALLRHLEIDKAHIVGFSMGSFAALFFGLRYPELARSVVPVCCGYGAAEGWEDLHKKNFFEFAEALEDDAKADDASDRYAIGSTRVQFAEKDPRGWQEFADQFRALSRQGRAMSLRHVVAARPSVYTFEEEMKKMQVPVLLITGDEDEQTLLPGVFMKNTIPTAGLCVLPRIGHTLNLEEPGLFNMMLYDFFTAVELGRWRPRDPRTFETKHYLASEDETD